MPKPLPPAAGATRSPILTDAPAATLSADMLHYDSRMLTTVIDLLDMSLRAKPSCAGEVAVLRELEAAARDLHKGRERLNIASLLLKVAAK